MASKINLNIKVATGRDRQEKKRKTRVDSRENTILKALCQVSDQK